MDNQEAIDMSKFKYLVLDAAPELSDIFYICTYCGAKTPVKNAMIHLPSCPAPIVFNSLSKKPIDIELVS